MGGRPTTSAIAHFPRRNGGVKEPCPNKAGSAFLQRPGASCTEQGQPGARASLRSVNGTKGILQYIDSIILQGKPSQDSDTHELSLEVEEMGLLGRLFNIKCNTNFAVMCKELEVWVPLHPVSAA